MATPPIQTREPELFAVGDTLLFQRLIRDFLPSDGWSLLYEIRGGASGTSTPVSFTSTADGDWHKISVAASTTAAWLPGDYVLAGYLVNSGLSQRNQFYLGELTLQTNRGSNTDATEQTHYQKMIVLLEGQLETLAAHAIQDSTVQQSEFRRVKRKELEEQLAFNKEMRNIEIRQEAIRNGYQNPAFIQPVANITP